MFNSKRVTRRSFLATGVLSAIAMTVPRCHACCKQKGKTKIILRSSWQMVNIGDIAHTPGVLALLEQYIPEAEVTLWASGSHSSEVSAMEMARFPRLKIVKGSVSPDGRRVNNDELRDALDKAEFILHGSGPSMVAYKDVRAAVTRTGLPFGVYGITYQKAEEEQRQFMSKAKFLYFRDSVSLGKAKADGITSPVMEFGPDGGFAVDLRNDDAALAFMKAHSLEEGKFACVIPRYRVTPYWQIHGRELKSEKDKAGWAKSQKMKEHDNRPIRDAICDVLKKTDFKILICPEDKSQMALGKEILYDKIPENLRNRVVWRENYWLTDEAVSTYIRSAGLFGLEMHSPIMCIGNGIPAIVCRFAEQTSKGFMWNDIGLNDWLFDLDKESDLPRIPPAVVDMLTNRAATQKKVAAAQKVVRTRQYETMQNLRSELDMN